jgi:hypothetical protein
MLDVAQAFAWARMFAGYAGTESLAAAAGETFDAGKPCAICRALGRAREASGRHGPAVPSAGGQRMLLILERPMPLLSVPPPGRWPAAPATCAEARAAEVPVPPPRAALA